MNGPALRLELRRDVEELTRLNTALESFLADQAADPRTAYAAKLTFEELFTNVLRHAEDATRVVALMARTDDGYEIRFEDDGAPFDPFTAPQPDLAAPIEERARGGFGLFLLRRLTRGMDYERDGATNRIRVTL